MTTLLTSNGQVMQVDEADLADLAKVSWHAQWDPTIRNFYVYHSTMRHGKTRREAIHRYLMKAAPRQPVDHINHDTLDNRRANLRLCTLSQNQWNRRPDRNTSSGLKGVTWCNTKKRWAARIRINGKKTALGYFDDKHVAHAAYVAAARANFGEYVCVA